MVEIYGGRQMKAVKASATNPEQTICLYKDGSVGLHVADFENTKTSNRVTYKTRNKEEKKAIQRLIEKLNLLAMGYIGKECTTCSQEVVEEELEMLSHLKNKELWAAIRDCCDVSYIPASDDEVLHELNTGLDSLDVVEAMMLVEQNFVNEGGDGLIEISEEDWERFINNEPTLNKLAALIEEWKK